MESPAWRERSSPGRKEKRRVTRRRRTDDYRRRTRLRGSNGGSSLSSVRFQNGQGTLVYSARLQRNGDSDDLSGQKRQTIRRRRCREWPHSRLKQHGISHHILIAVVQRL